MTRMRIGLAIVSLLGFGAGFAAAEPHIVVESPPVFLPRADFQFDNDGYYRTHDGHYYHYDRDRDGWHYGRTHREGLRYEQEHEHHEHRR